MRAFLKRLGSVVRSGSHLCITFKSRRAALSRASSDWIQSFLGSLDRHGRTHWRLSTSPSHIILLVQKIIVASAMRHQLPSVDSALLAGVPHPCSIHTY